MRLFALILPFTLSLELIAAHDYHAHEQREFSAKRLNDLAAKWGIDVSILVQNNQT
jgi:hypothetical protein